MDADERRALKSLSLSWVPTSEDVWQQSLGHLNGLHRDAEQKIEQGIERAADSPGSSPVGLVVQGEGGAGKTHLLGWAKQEVLNRGGYFFLVDFSAGVDFWEHVRRHVRKDLVRPTAERSTQIADLVKRLINRTRLRSDQALSVTGATPILRSAVDALVEGVARVDRELALECQDVIRALVLYAADDFSISNCGKDFLDSQPDDQGLYAQWGMRDPAPARTVVEHISRVLAFTGPSVIAVDQLDSLLHVTWKSAAGTSGSEPSNEQVDSDRLLEEVAGGLMDLRQLTRRTLCLLACLPTSWTLVKERALATVQDRYIEGTPLGTISTSDIAKALVAKRFAADYASIDFTPVYSTWPVATEAFTTAPGLTPRELLKRINGFVERSLANGTVQELKSFAENSGADTPDESAQPSYTADLSALTARFEKLCRSVDIANVLDHERGDAELGDLIRTGLSSWIRELGSNGWNFTLDPAPIGMSPDLHALLRRVLDVADEIQEHWGFRAIGAPSWQTALKNLREANKAAGSALGHGHRLIVVRNIPWVKGAKSKTQEELALLRTAGGASLCIGNADLARFAALKVMLAEQHPDLDDWLVQQRPAAGSEFLHTVLGKVVVDRRPSPDGSDAGRSGPTPEPFVTPDPDRGLKLDLGPEANEDSEPQAIPVGVAARGGAPVTLALDSLRRHTAIMAGSGSGKTVLIRRIVEEAALCGVSSIVLDPNNDLARLGDPWPATDTSRDAEQERRAARYFGNTDVVVWTPGRSSGRPLSFQPLPDLGPLVDDVDELEEAITGAVSALLSRASAGTARSSWPRNEAVLRQTLRHQAVSGAPGLSALIDLLADLPDEASSFRRASQIAASMAEALEVAKENDRVFGGTGTPVDPAILLTPPSGKRARISVISFEGLSDDERPGFVNGLQANLFSWLKRHPAADGTLSCLLVMDEAQTLAPSRGSTAASSTTRSLASQGRKYGLGMVFATQGPKDVDNSVIGNSLTQFYGRMTAGSHIQAVQEIARSKGTEADRIGRLEPGQYYLTGQAHTFASIRTPLCLSYHGGPLAPDEVLERARRGQ